MLFEDVETLLGRAFSDCVHSTAALEGDGTAESCVDLPIYLLSTLWCPAIFGDTFPTRDLLGEEKPCERGSHNVKDK